MIFSRREGNYETRERHEKRTERGRLARESENKGGQDARPPLNGVLRGIKNFACFVVGVGWSVADKKGK